MVAGRGQNPGMPLTLGCLAVGGHLARLSFSCAWGKEGVCLWETRPPTSRSPCYSWPCVPLPGNRTLGQEWMD